MGFFDIFRTPKCPRCGRDATLDSDGLRDFLTCIPCVRKFRQEKQEKQQMQNRVAALEAEIEKLKGEKK